jgi:predicted outer membrane protein
MNTRVLLKTAVCIGCMLGVEVRMAAAEVSNADKAFLDAMAASDMTEVELSRLVTSQPLSSQVRDFAQTLAVDHTENYQALLDLCNEKNYTVAPRIDAAHGEVMRKLRAAGSPEAAAHAFLDAVSSDQSALDSLLEQIAGNSNDAEIARFAADTLAAVKNHEESAKQLTSR